MALRDLFRRRTNDQATDGGAPARKSSATGPVVAYHSSGRVVWSARDTVSLTKTGYCGNPVGFRVVKLISEAAAAVPLILQDRDTRYSDHPVLRLIQSPNAAQTQADFFESLYGQLILSGNAYVEGVANDTGIAELHVLRSDRMALVPGADGWPVAYDYTVGGRKHRFNMGGDFDPICHIRNFHPQDDHYGFSPLQAAAQALDVHNAATQWSKALLDNAARPSGAIVHNADDSLTQEQFDRLQFELESYHQGARNAGRPMLLEGGLDWKPMGFSPSDMEFQKTKEAAARDIAIAFGVPPMLLGIPGDATYANYQEANRAFFRLTVLPLVRRVGAHLAQWLGDDAMLGLVPDLDQIPALSAERDAHWSRVAASDFLTDAEKRHLLGLPTLDGGLDAGH